MPTWTPLYKDPNNKIHGANFGPTWVLSAPGGPNVGPMDLAIRGQDPHELYCFSLFSKISKCCYVLELFKWVRSNQWNIYSQKKQNKNPNEWPLTLLQKYDFWTFLFERVFSTKTQYEYTKISRIKVQYATRRLNYDEFLNKHQPMEPRIMNSPFFL